MDWPTTLPQPQQQGYTETLPDNVIRTKMDVGPGKLRRRSTAAPRTLTLEYLLTAVEVTYLDTFYVTTSKYGSLSFNFTHPRTAVVYAARFLKPPTYSSLEHYATASVELELLA